MDFNAALENWATANNPFFEGAHSDALSMLPYLALVAFLLFVAREQLLTTHKR